MKTLLLRRVPAGTPIAGACLTTSIWRCRNLFIQWQHSFLWKLRSHWLKFLQQRHVAVVRQGPGTRMYSVIANRVKCQLLGITSMYVIIRHWCRSILSCIREVKNDQKCHDDVLFVVDFQHRIIGCRLSYIVVKLWIHLPRNTHAVYAFLYFVLCSPSELLHRLWSNLTFAPEPVKQSWLTWINTLTWTRYMMTSSNGNIFRVTGPLCREFTGQRWIPRTKASDAELWCFLWSVSE